MKLALRHKLLRILQRLEVELYGFVLTEPFALTMNASQLSLPRVVSLNYDYAATGPITPSALAAKMGVKASQIITVHP